MAKSKIRAGSLLVLTVATLSLCVADPAPVIHYAPAENLEHVDVALIDRAERKIDIAAYVLTDWAGHVGIDPRSPPRGQGSHLYGRQTNRRAGSGTALPGAD